MITAVRHRREICAPSLLLFLLIVTATAPAEGNPFILSGTMSRAPAPASLFTWRTGCNDSFPAHFRMLVQASAPRGQTGEQVTSGFKEIDNLIDAGKLGEARLLLARKIAEHGQSYQSLFREAKILFRERNYRESLKVLERCLGLNSNDAEVYKLIASDAILLDRMDIAEQALKTATHLAPDDYLVLFNLGALYYTNSRFPQAQPVLEKSVRLNPDYVPSRLFLGLTLEELGLEDAAADSYHRAIEIAERSGSRGEPPFLYLGRLLYRQNRIEESLPYLQKAVRANPKSCESLCLLSRSLSLRGRETEAVSCLNQCLQADPKYAEAHYLLSRAYVREGRTNDAAKELALFQELKKLDQNTKDPRKNQRADR